MPLHIIETIMIIVAIILAGVRLTKITTRTRTDMMAIAMGAKSLVVIAYQLLSEHVAQWKRFASLKANLILNSLEIVFWAAVAFMAIQSNTRSCSGASCGLGWGVLVIAILVSNVSIYMTGISYFAFRRSRENKSSDSSDTHLRTVRGSTV
ncbi:unnamed protein product [Clonostachys rosea]|uniref:MARVEL domain-containing protein n=1 Tax=Bionectria ochroleuca TaxID=29856 RepID=A0ABY6UCE3_BIOOC|nr:unnamed protein product [Clonostachys rosea]